MIVLHGTEHWASARLPSPVLTIGNFDGVHLGHQSLIRATQALALDLGAPSAVLTFDPTPRDVLRPGHGIHRIESLARRLVHLERTGVEYVIVQTFDTALAGVPADRFCRERLRAHLDVMGVVVGHDFRFGHGRGGDGALLRRVLEVPVETVPALADEVGPVSSSRIRAAITSGDVAEAARLLGRDHELVGVVVPGDRRGATIGFPTANLEPGGGLLPPHGVYAVRVLLDGLVRAGVANFGVRPTFGATAPRLEVHLFGGPYELYGRTLTVGLVERVRGERTFPSVDALVAQIRADVEEAKRILA